jgi:uroporphyrinogen-III decarboxylase
LRTRYRIETPSGVLTCVRTQTPDDFGTIDEPFIKEEDDVALLRHRPDPRRIINPSLIRQSVDLMAERCWAMASVVGVWGLASFYRGPERIMMDCFDRPEWVKRFLGILGDYQVALVQGIGAASAPPPVLRLDGSFIGFGLSRRLFKEFIQPDDQHIIEAAHGVGMPVHLHICGKKNVFLEDLADMGLEALETLTPAVAAGDIDLGDAKRRIGARVCLMGGFLSHTLTFGTPSEVRAGVKECLEAVKANGGCEGYILSPSGRVDPETPEENLHAFGAAGREYGRMA